ncbi:copper oxidase [Actinosynnema sp. ALI-1.44]|uniref:multicopper oxidase family protein n=1 Tax=Actinosynnema sp. ALI-1.44 TaxID=1933779 RepID=UPI00097BBD32|nr:multicopper oxidase domain-containing protein [Actinosynnema sp. ALI-1.44]ONI83008.1 copper oxidase [Actinosynnema sp. ALI-1.44]
MKRRDTPQLGRRRFLGLLGASGLVAVTTGIAGCGNRAGGQVLSGPGKVLASKLPLPAKFERPLTVPPVVRPVRTDRGADYYELVQRLGDVEILPGRRTQVMGFDGRFPGPTFETRRDRRAVVRISNELPVPTSTHLHGGVTDPDSDGYPTDLVLPGGYPVHEMHGGHSEHMAKPEDYTFHQVSKTHVYDLPQRAATLWYHDHRMDFSGPQVYHGLAGMFLVRDAEEDALPLPKGDKELPLMICDRSFNEDGSFNYPALDRRLKSLPGVEDDYMDGVLGDVMLVNGTPWPTHDVANTRYRLRLLNACNARRLELALSRAPKEGAPFVQIGSDGGLLEKPQDMTTLPMSPAERYDVIVDFSKFDVGTEVVLANVAGADSTAEVMRFRVTRQETDRSSIPDRLSHFEKLDRSQAVATRSFDFRRGATNQDHDWTINGRGFTVSAYEAEPRMDTVELWKFTSDFHHPVHVHLGHFQVVSRNGGAPEPRDAGWKDTVDVRPFGVVEVLVKFTHFKGRYMIHCHNLEHEDMAMMVNFRTT